MGRGRKKNPVLCSEWAKTGPDLWRLDEAVRFELIVEMVRSDFRAKRPFQIFFAGPTARFKLDRSMLI